MLHNINGVTVNVFCGHPDIENNECPTRDGDCGSCRHCMATMSYMDFDKMDDFLSGLLGQNYFTNWKEEEVKRNGKSNN